MLVFWVTNKNNSLSFVSTATCVICLEGVDGNGISVIQKKVLKGSKFEFKYHSSGTFSKLSGKKNKYNNSYRKPLLILLFRPKNFLRYNDNSQNRHAVNFLSLISCEPCNNSKIN